MHTGALNINGAIEFPTADGTSGQVLQTNGSGTLSFGTIDTSSLMPLAGGTFTGDVTFTGDSYNVVWDKSDSALEFADNAKAVFGTGGDLEIYHDGTQSVIDSNLSSAYLNIISGGGFSLKTSGGTNSIVGFQSGGVSLYTNGSLKLATSTTGVQVTGNITVSGTVDGRDVATDGTKLDGIEASADVTDATNVAAAGAAMTTGATFTGDVNFDGATAGRDIVFDRSASQLRFSDNAKAVFGDGTDATIHWNGSALEFSSELGDVLIRGNNEIKLQAHTGENFFVGLSNGASTLYYDNSAKLATTSTGIDVTGTVTDDGATHDGDVTFTGASYNAVWDKSQNALEFADNAKAVFGTGGDLDLYHNGTNSFITNATGTLYIQQAANDADVRIRSDDGSGGYAEYITAEGATGEVQLHHYGSQKLATKTGGIDVTGEVNADDYVVDLNGVVRFKDTSSVEQAKIGLHSQARLYMGSTGTSSNAYMRFDGEGTTPIIEPAAAAGAQPTTETIDFGASDNRWKDIYGKNLNVSADITVGGTVDGRDIATNIPASLGTAGQVLTVNAGATAGEWADAAGAADGVFYENNTNVTANYTITSGKNAMSAGPITIDSGVTVTVPSGSTWTVVT